MYPAKKFISKKSRLFGVEELLLQHLFWAAKHPCTSWDFN
jgi:hypothetical protein